MEYTLYGTRMCSREDAQLHIAEVFSFPDWYGRNLDALFDLLTAWTEPAVIHLLDGAEMDAALGAYARGLRRVFADAAAQNPNLTLRF